jgi:hypothetical protein
MARDDGHTVVVIEHQATAIAHADHIIDVGPAAGSEGGRILFSGDRFDFQKSDAPSAKAFEQEPGMRRHWTATSESVQVTGDSAPAGGDGIALLSEGSDLDGVWEHAARIRPVVKVAARAANQDARVWELLDLAPTILRFADREGSSGRVTAAASDDELRARLRSDACAFSPVARHLRMQGPALIDLKPAVIALLSLGYTEAVLDGKKHPLKELPKFVKDRLGLRSCLVVHPRDATHLIETTIRWSAGVISLLGRSPAVENILSLRHIADDGKIGAAFGDPHVADSRSPVGRCGSCAGSGLVRTYDLSLVVRKMSASIADKAFLAPELAAAFRGALTREILPAARVFTEQGVVDLLTPPSRLERGDRFAFEYGIERRLLKASAKRTDREADWHRWRGLHDYVYQSWSRIPDDLRARLRASYREVTCPACTGTGLTWESERVFIGRRSVRDWWAGGKVKELAAALPDYRALKLAVASGLGDLRLGARLSELDAQSTAIQLVSAVVGPLRGVELTVPDVSDFDGLRRSLRRESMQLSSTEMAPDVP